ncbi:hypothetical protein, partial [Kitasatospora sp. NPDC093558]|uniref:hypothetical protein n=1 Tax=Kitasatospora sp. NPDC093558 TaxID=3155201 RepID=UPI00343AAFC9
MRLVLLAVLSQAPTKRGELGLDPALVDDLAVVVAAVGAHPLAGRLNRLQGRTDGLQLPLGLVAVGTVQLPIVDLLRQRRRQRIGDPAQFGEQPLGHVQHVALDPLVVQRVAVARRGLGPSGDQVVEVPVLPVCALARVAAQPLPVQLGERHGDEHRPRVPPRPAAFRLRVPVVARDHVRDGRRLGPEPLGQTPPIPVVGLGVVPDGLSLVELHPAVGVQSAVDVDVAVVIDLHPGQGLGVEL